MILFIRLEVNNMWDTIIGVIIGAVLSFFPTWYFSNRAHKWELDEKKREREFASREIRLREGEEINRILSIEFYGLSQLADKLITVHTVEELQNMQKFVNEYEKNKEAL